MTRTETYMQLRRAFDQGRCFLAVMLPQSAEMQFFAEGEFEVAPWPASGDSAEIPTATTERELYETSLSKLISSLDKGQKTVISRNIAGEFSEFDPARMALDYFASIQGALRFVFSTGNGDWWMGATPELLLENVDNEPNLFHTRALAGTQPADGPAPWSDKNIAEQRIVVDDILCRLAKLGVSVDAKEPRDLVYGRIKHICTDIYVRSSEGVLDIKSLASAIHPTPAVGGYPRDIAMANIQSYEAAPRNFYGGTLAFSTACGSKVYVILRTVHFNSRRWCIYTGSGVTVDSVPSDEWAETQAKALPLLNAVAPYSNNLSPQ